MSVKRVNSGERCFAAVDSMQTPPLEGDAKWFDRFDELTALRPSKGKLTILSKVEGPMGFPKGRSGSSPLWSDTGI